MKEGQEGYFEAALSDFMFDVAAGGAIRHLVDRGYSVEQILQKLDYPVSRTKVEKAVFKRLQESGILLSELPEECEKVQMRCLREADKDKFSITLLDNIRKYGEQNSYVACPFGQWLRQDGEQMHRASAFLTSREKEYIQGIHWENAVMYHRLNDRMREIVVKLAAHMQEEWAFYFLKDAASSK
ncbi:MAG: hypothetical protein NC419_09535 [Muribaculaceae bacterium]|nr:hypothetical protein [Muribaculaceae bacterium]